MSHTPNYDAKVKAILDATAPGERVCALTGEKWMMTEEEIGWYRKFNVPPSSFAPIVRMRQMMSFFVGYEWWYQRHPETGKQIVSFIHPSSGIKVLPDQEWFAKDFSGIQCEYDSTQNFFSQLHDLYRQIPVNALRNMVEPVNSIAAASFGDVNSYFVLAAKMKDSLYSSDATGENSCEIFACHDVHDSYNVAMSRSIQNCRFVRDSRQCFSSAFLFDCFDCESCFGATNKHHKKFLWWNEQLSEGEWRKRFQDIDLSCRSRVEEYQKKFDDLLSNTAIWPENFNYNATNCTGEYLFDSTNMQDCYFAAHNSKDQFHTAYSYQESSDCAYAIVFANSAHLYQCWLAVRSSHCKYCMAITQCDSCEYSVNCYNCTNCFGCVGLQRKRFCIFNKQYAEDAYWKKLDEMKTQMLSSGEYGRWFPLAMSHCYVKTSGAVLVYLTTEEQFAHMGANFFEPESNGAVGEQLEDTFKMRQASDVPDCISALSDDWLNIPVFDAEVKRRYAYIKPEKAFYERMKIAPPNNHFTERVKNLFRQSNSAVFEDIVCAKCKKRIRTGKNIMYPKRKVYCKPCYVEFLEKNS